MLKFFRQIRQNLISQNKLSKYLFYAIGEIVLVVIGILIALQINNANETRKQRIVERSYLKRLVVDLRENKNLWKERINMQEKQLDGANGILNLSFDENQNEKIRQMLPYFQALATLDDIYINQVTFNEMVSSGNLNLISSDSIRLKLLDLDKQYQIIMNGWENTVKNNDKLIMEPILDIMSFRYTFPLNPEQQAVHTRKYTQEELNEYLTLYLDEFRTLIKNKSFMNGLSMINANSDSNIQRFKQAESQVDELILLIENNLKIVN